MIYEVVVEWGPTYYCVKACRKLAVLWHSRKSSLHGPCVVGFLAPTDDCERIKLLPALSQVGEVTEAQSVPPRLDTKDSNGTPLVAELPHEQEEDTGDTFEDVAGVNEGKVDASAYVHQSLLGSSCLSPSVKETRQKSGRSHTQGTPARLLKDGLCDVRSDRSTRSRPQLRLDAFAETNYIGKISSLLGVLSSWNIQLPRVHCCEYHCLVNEGIFQLKAMRNRNCVKQSLQPVGCCNWQCSNCGIVYVVDSNDDSQEIACDFCSEQDEQIHAHGAIQLDSETVVHVSL